MIMMLLEFLYFCHKLIEKPNHMKKRLFVMALMTTVFAGCSSDDSNGSNAADYPELILGKWATVGSTVNGGPFNEYTNDCPTQEDYNEFKADGSITYYGYNEECQNTEVEPGTYELDGDMLYLYDSFDPPLDDEFTILTLNQNTLKLKEVYTDGPDGEFTVITTLKRID